MEDNEVTSLFSGNVILIDDEINKTTGTLEQITNELSNNNSMFLIKLDKLPQKDDITKYSNVSFMILDWKFNMGTEDIGINSDDMSALTMSSDFIDSEVISFLKSINTDYFFPIFIFSNEDTEYIKGKLVNEKLYSCEIPNNILIRSKKDKYVGLIETLKQWLIENPAIYVLKKWDMEYQRSKSQLFKSLSSISCYWPNILWKCYEKDNVNASEELSELISKNLSSRIINFEYDKELLKETKSYDKKTLINVLENSKFIKEEYLEKNENFTGDLFVKGTNKYCYFLNIRPECDIKDNVSELYLLPGKILNEDECRKAFSPDYGVFEEKISNAIVSFIGDGKIIEFCFKRFKIVRRNALEKEKYKRVGRLLSPYITRIQQKFAFYLQRQGLPRTPIEAILDVFIS